jgi:hypothetical protein
MPTDITYLNVPRDAEAHAKRFGAQRDASGNWYVIGEVPGELLNYLPKQPNRHFHDVPPGCPVCGSGMRKSIDRSGNLYWVCMARFRTGCRGQIDYIDYLDRVAPVSAVGDFLPKLAGPLLLPGGNTPHAQSGLDRRMPHPLRERWVRIVKLAFEILGNDRQVMCWLSKAKVALGGKPPIQMLGTKRGCDAVQRLLSELRS